MALSRLMVALVALFPLAAHAAPAEAQVAERWRTPFAVESRGGVAPREPSVAVVREAPEGAVKGDSTANGASGKAAAGPAARDTASAGAEEETAASGDAAAQPETRTHLVKTGDTLFGIARRYGVSAARIREANRMDSDVVKLGQKLLIPAAD